MTKTRAKAIKLYWNIAKERCPFHEEEMVNSFLEGFIDCAEYLLLQNTELEKENAELRTRCNELFLQTCEQAEKIKELKSEIENDRDLPVIAYMQGAEKQKKKDEEKLTKAIEILKKYHKECPSKYSFEDIDDMAEQFISEVEK